MLYPKALVGRLEISNDIRANVEVNAQKFHSASRSIDIEQVKELSALVLRLEALSAAQHNPPAAPPSDPTSPKPGSARLAVTTSSQQVPQVSRPPSFLGPCIREDMTDEELTLIIESLTTRAENTMSTLVCPIYEEIAGLTCSISNTLVDSLRSWLLLNRRQGRIRG